MRFLNSSWLLVALSTGASAFAPPALRQKTAFKTARSFGVDPSAFQDVLASSSVFLSEAVEEAASSVAGAVDTVSEAAARVSDVAATSIAAPPPQVVEAATEVAKTDNGWFGFLTGPIESLLQGIHSLFVAVGVSADAWGISIIALTILIKVVTFPLTKTQLESTNKMQALQPVIKDLQVKYESNPEVMNQKIAEVYQTNEVNPLAGCLPSLVQIPVFIGLYRAVLDLAAENKLDEAFLWLPNLEGPTYGADPTSGSDWILKGWVDGVPSLGWDDTTAFLILPVLLVVSQYASMQIMQPKNAPQQNNIVLQILPIMIGWFSLNVPAALCLYWFTNNIVTTITTVAIRSSMGDMTPVAPGAAAAAPPTPEIFAPPPLRDQPAGFGSSLEVVDDAGVKTITATDAEIIEDDADEEEESAPTSGGKKKRKKRGKKRKN